MGLKGAPVAEDGSIVWHARTVPEVADGMRELAGMLAGIEAPEPPEPPDLSGYVPLADFQALEAEVGVLTGRVDAAETGLAVAVADLADLEARVVALETPPAP
jgi:phage I-like protein